jgi:hypothetical protein
MGTGLAGSWAGGQFVGLALGLSIMSLVGVVLARLDADSEVEMGVVVAVDAVG